MGVSGFVALFFIFLVFAPLGFIGIESLTTFLFLKERAQEYIIQFRDG